MLLEDFPTCTVVMRLYKKEETERKKRYVSSPYLDDLESQPKSVELFRVVDAVQSDAPGVVEVGVVFS